jgi:hypothetical protein
MKRKARKENKWGKMYRYKMCIFQKNLKKVTGTTYSAGKCPAAPAAPLPGNF